MLPHADVYGRPCPSGAAAACVMLAQDVCVVFPPALGNATTPRNVSKRSIRGSSLVAHHRYFEDLIATAIAADAEANAPTEEVLTEEERREVAELRQAVDGLSDKYDTILGSLREDEVCAKGRHRCGSNRRFETMCVDGWRSWCVPASCI